MRPFLASSAPAALILEDDAEVGGSVAALRRSLEWWPEGHGLVHLGSPENIRTRRRCCLARPVGHAPCRRQLRPILRKHLGAYGYLIDRATAGRILEIAPHVPVPIDHLLFDMVDSAVARCARPLQMTPAPIRHRPHALVGSDTTEPEEPGTQELVGPGAVEGERGGSALSQAAVGMAAVDGAGAKRLGYVRGVSHAGCCVFRRSAAAFRMTLERCPGVGVSVTTDIDAHTFEREHYRIAYVWKARLTSWMGGDRSKSHGRKDFRDFARTLGWAGDM